MAFEFHVYILASKSGVLYIGITNDLEYRVWQHKSKSIPGFTAKYNVNRLVYYEDYSYVNDAIAREKELKGWRRSKKTALINGDNPNWNDLAAEWTKYPDTSEHEVKEVPPTSG